LINKIWSSQEYLIEVFLPRYKGRTSKRYNDFYAFNEALSTKFKILPFPEFPRKFQLMNKKETRRKKFEELVELILGYADEYPELKDKLFGILYSFIIAQCKTLEVTKGSFALPDSNIN
jgi:hypothetical protein